MGAIIVELKCLTNLHAGNGDVNYNIIDNEVEKDPVTGNPTINSSGVKGALRQYCSYTNPGKVEDWFGSDSSVKNNHKQGKLKILSANILSIPLRATTGDYAYQLVITQQMLDQYKTLCDVFGIGDQVEEMTNPECVSVEGISVSKAYRIGNIIEKTYLIDQKSLSGISLPVVARNNLENGISKNLWYEEIVPHESVFYFIAASEDEGTLTEFKEFLNGKVVQFGGNATIGYGLCKVTVRGIE